MQRDSTAQKRRYFLEDAHLRVEDYKNSQLAQKSLLTGTTSLDEADAYLWYLENQVAYLIKPYFNRLKAKVHKFDKDGLSSSDLIANGTQVRYAQIWNDAHAPILTKGTGASSTWNKDKTENMQSSYKDSLLVSAFIYRPAQKDSLFIKVDRMAEPKMGFSAFTQKLASTIPYPENELSYGRQATIYIQFTVNEAGQLMDFVTLNDSYKDFNKAVIRKLEALAAWNPALINGRQVKTRYILPIVFQIEE
ncbi:hypothetical protein GCM10023183_33530 [Nibribacter koreensis]|uniref:TonB C-terminal domain-containing protein n=1 Tax=Nibribacter koreensis TaxID=1084519 RepID=A0ABP8FYL5_9BACT